ncbi:unnamed protein product [Durusdinium trenchii]|uniref:Sugar phosphate transporter domain-containing protein n=1 Tax=Durusdinium trenchii TaxID=1381693 RepID=A0ABP0MK16_9DINO
MGNQLTRLSENGSPSMERLEGLSSASAYVASSLAMTSLTKYAASAWRFPGSSFLLLIECWGTVLALGTSRDSRGRRYQPLAIPILRHMLLVTVTKAVNMYLSFSAMKRTSLPVYNVLKRLQPVYAMIQDRLIRGSRPTTKEFWGVVLMSVGTVVTGLGDLDFDLAGYGLALIAAACQSLYLVLARHAQDQVALSSMDLVFYTAFYNSVLFVPLTLLELSEVLVFLQRAGEKYNFFQFLIPYVMVGVLLNYATFWSTAVNDPVATAVAGTLKGVLSSVIGILMFGVRLTPVGWLGLIISTIGGMAYSHAHTAAHPKKA